MSPSNKEQVDWRGAMESLLCCVERLTKAYLEGRQQDVYAELMEQMPLRVKTARSLLGDQHPADDRAANESRDIAAALGLNEHPDAESASVSPGAGKRMDESAPQVSFVPCLPERVAAGRHREKRRSNDKDSR